MPSGTTVSHYSTCRSRHTNCKIVIYMLTFNLFSCEHFCSHFPNDIHHNFLDMRAVDCMSGHCENLVGCQTVIEYLTFNWVSIACLHQMKNESFVPVDIVKQSLYITWNSNYTCNSGGFLHCGSCTHEFTGDSLTGPVSGKELIFASKQSILFSTSLRRSCKL